jgi:hypothetical protein
MQEIADWREKLGMSEYAQRFTEHKIDISVLGHLTEKYSRLSVSLPALPRRHPNLLPDRSRTHRTLPSAVKITVQTDATDGSEHNRIVNGPMDAAPRHRPPPPRCRPLTY